MPQNKNLKPVDLPMELKFGQRPKTQFYNNLSHLKVELVDHPTRSQALNVAWQYVKATWADHHDDTNPSTASLKELSAESRGCSLFSRASNSYGMPRVHV